jgi:acetyl esterase/lipase
MLKRAMDVFYASVGAAIKITDATPNWQTTLATAAAASFYSLTGASLQASQETSSSSARDLIQSAWGMVSLPAVKNLSLQASRILKGAAVADRIEIMGVSCFVLSREPAPEMAAAIKRFHRQHRRKNSLHTTLSTIDEGAELNPDTVRSVRPFARTWGHYRQRDVIFHLTGGGFFAHIIASDLPYLLDWSASTGAVVICPEYALLPDHKFPDALLQVEDVYRALRQGEAVSALGFEVNRIVVTGESAGGNLAAALCVKICMDSKAASQENEVPSGDKSTDTSTVSAEEEIGREDAHSLGIPDAAPLLPLPDALMLSCAVLNLSLELSYSRVVGTGDPVLPSGLISAISDAYLPIGDGVDKKDPLASPFFALDNVLCQFPPTLLFASSNDPLLDDSVVFNQRLRSLGVESELRAAQNLPHAYLGLGTAGFPEAQQVQQECQEWLKFQFTRNRDDEDGPSIGDSN